MVQRVFTVIVVLFIFSASNDAKGGEAELVIPPEEVMHYLNRLNESARDIKESSDFKEFEDLSGRISADLKEYRGSCDVGEQNADCLAEEASLLRDIHTYVNRAHSFAEQMIESLNIPANVRYALFKSIQLQRTKTSPTEKNIAKSIKNIFPTQDDSLSLAVLSGLEEVFTPMPDHAPRLERALAKRLGELEADYIFLKGAKKYLKSVAQLKYSRLSVEVVEKRLNSLTEPLTFLKHTLFGEVSKSEENKEPAALKILEKLKKEK
ncbi:MAG: hypothetical protein WBD99_02095 [Thermodesulfobacteriota bacterium]